jgi:hypothetical protein
MNRPMKKSDPHRSNQQRNGTKRVRRAGDNRPFAGIVRASTSWRC